MGWPFDLSVSQGRSRLWNGGFREAMRRSRRPRGVGEHCACEGQHPSGTGDPGSRQGRIRGLETKSPARHGYPGHPVPTTSPALSTLDRSRPSPRGPPWFPVAAVTKQLKMHFVTVWRRGALHRSHGAEAEASATPAAQAVGTAPCPLRRPRRVAEHSGPCLRLHTPPPRVSSPSACLRRTLEMAPSARPGRPGRPPRLILVTSTEALFPNKITLVL